MILLITLISIALIWGLVGAWYDEFEWQNILFHIFVRCIICLPIGFILALLLPADKTDCNFSFEIENLQDNSSVSGNFFIGCGQIEGKMKYVLYRKDGDLYEMIQLNYEDVKIRYDNSTPKVYVSQKCNSDAFINNFAIDISGYSQSYVISVPNGTIKNNFTLDAQ